jgi:hypothetical protein
MDVIVPSLLQPKINLNAEINTKEFHVLEIGIDFVCIKVP